MLIGSRIGRGGVRGGFCNKFIRKKWYLIKRNYFRIEFVFVFYISYGFFFYEFVYKIGVDEFVMFFFGVNYYWFLVSKENDNFVVGLG